MSEENQEVTQTELTNDVQYSEIEQEAMQHGWKPKEEYEGDPDKWRSAELFMALKPFYEKIESQSKLIKQNQKAFAQVARDMQQVKIQAYEKALADLKAKRREALSEGDVDQLDIIEDQMTVLREQQRAVKEAPVQQQEDVSPLYVDFKARNSWYDRDEDLRDWAEARGMRLAQGGMPAEEVFKTLEREVKTRFPEKFKNPKRDQPSAVTGGGNKASSAKAERLNMSPEERRIMETIVRSGALTEEEYIKQYLAQQ